MTHIINLSEHSVTCTLPYSQKMERLIHIIQEISMSHDLEIIMRTVRQVSRELTGADGATFVPREGNVCYYADEDAISPLWKGRRFPIEMCISGWVMQNREPAIIKDIYQDARIPIDAYCHTFVKSLVMVPIRTLDPVGAIGTYWAKQYQASQEEVRLLCALADTTAVAMENVRIYAELERRVQERTAALESINKRLAEEIVERQQAEAEVRMLIENLPQRIFYKDKNLVYVLCNKNYTKNLHREPCSQHSPQSSFICKM